MSKDKKWMTLNSHGKFCLQNFLYSISSSDVWQPYLDYLYNKGLVDYSQRYHDSEHRNVNAGHCLTDLGIHTSVHYFPKYSSFKDALINP